MVADRHLLLGLHALQNGLIQPARLVAAFHGGTGDKSRTLADNLIALGHLSPAQRSVIETLARPAHRGPRRCGAEPGRPPGWALHPAQPGGLAQPRRGR
jgi:hypothetical protein